MEQKTALVSRGGNKIKLKYSIGGQDIIKVWEEKGDGVLEITFDGSGAVMKQQLLKSGKDKINSIIQAELGSASIASIRESPYEEVRLAKPCPKCGSDELVMQSRSVTGTDLPVVPVYLCANCNSKSYHLSTAYLEYLVNTNRELFSGAELAEYNRDNNAFIRELEGYILRIFASKKIARIL